MMTSVGINLAETREGGSAARPARKLRAALAFCAAALLFLAATDVSAQRSSRARSRRAATTRTRRAAAPAKANQKPAPEQDANAAGEATESAPSSQPEGASATPREKADDLTAPGAARPASEPGDTLDDLRAARDAAKSDAERARLDRLYVERLASDASAPAALAELRALVAGERYDPPLYYNIGNALARLGDSETAATAYRKAIDQRRGDYARALNNLGVVLLRTGDSAGAEEALLEALRRERSAYPEANYNLGRLYHARGEYELAARYLRRALRAQPAHTPAGLLLASALVADGDRDEARKVLTALRPADEEERRQIAAARAEIDSAAEAEDRPTATPAPATSAPRSTATEAPAPRRDAGASRPPASSPRSALPRYQLDRASFDLLQTARDRREAGAHAEAAALYRRVIDLRRGAFPPAQLELAYALISLRRNEEAISVLEPLAADHGKEFPVVYYHLARLHEAAGRLDRAADNFTRAAVLFGERNPQFLLDLARVRERMNDPTAALAAFETYLAVNERRGTSIDWAAPRLARLRERAAAQHAAANAKPAP